MPAGYDEAAADAIASLSAEAGNEQPEASEATASEEGAPETSEVPDSSESSTEETAAEEPQPGDADFDPQAWQLKFRDQTIVPKDRKHLVDLAQQGFSYSQRMQQLKQQEQDIQGKAQQYQQYEKLAQAFQSNPQFRDKLLAMYNESLAGGTQPTEKQAEAQEQVAQLPPQLLQEIEDLKQWRSQYEETQIDQTVKSEIESLKSKYSREDWDVPNTGGMSLMKEIIQHNFNNPAMSMEQAYRDIMFDKQTALAKTDTQNAKAEGLKQAAETRKKQVKAGVVAGKAPAAPKGGKGGVNPKASYDQLAQQAIAEFVK